MFFAPEDFALLRKDIEFVRQLRNLEVHTNDGLVRVQTAPGASNAILDLRALVAAAFRRLYVAPVPPATGYPLWSWGYNAVGFSGVGDGTQTQRNSAVQIGSEATWAVISGRYAIGGAIKTDGTLWTWGTNQYGALGLGDTTERNAPVQVGTGTDWAKVSFGGKEYAAAIKTDGTLWTWGLRDGGYIGHGTPPSPGDLYTTPQQVGSATDWADVKMAYATGGFLALKTTGTIWCTSTGTLVQIGSATDWAKISATVPSYYGIKTNGELWVWGENTNNELGLGDALDKASPVQVGSGTNWAMVSAGDRWTAGQGAFAMAIKTDGTLWATGYNYNSRIGNGTNSTNIASWTQLGSATDWAKVDAGDYHCAAITTGGKLYTWGDPGLGLLANGTTTPKISSPTQIGTDTDWRDIHSGTLNGYALKG